MNIDKMTELAITAKKGRTDFSSVAVVRELAMEKLGLSWDDAVQYAMERTYNQKNHSQAMAEINKQKEGK